MKKRKRRILAAVIAGAAAVVCAAAGIRQYLAEKEAGRGYDEVRKEVRTEEPEEETDIRTVPEVSVSQRSASR